MNTGLLGGATYPFRGLVFLLRNRQLWRYAVLPLVLNVVVLVIAAIVLSGYLDELLASATGFVSLERPDRWWGWPLLVLKGALKGVVGAAVLVASVLALYILFLLLAAILASPFNDVLSEKVEQIATGRVAPDDDQPFSILGTIRGGGTAILEELRKAGFFLGIFAITLTIGLIPGIGTVISAAAGGAISILFLTVEFTDFAMSRRKLLFADKRAFVFGHKRAVLGFGAVMAVGLTIPLANLFVLPIGAVAGTLLYLELEGAAADSARRAT